MVLLCQTARTATRYGVAIAKTKVRIMPLKRIAAIGDIHAEDELLEKAIVFSSGKVDLIVSVGDIVDGSGNVNRCCTLLREHKIPAVKGNHERWLLNNEMRLFAEVHYPEDIEKENLKWLRRLPSTLVFQTLRGTALLCHGLGENDMKTLLPDESGYALSANEDLNKLLRESLYRYVIKGHSHRRMVRRLDDVTFINAGTLLQKHGPGFCIIDFGKQQVQFFDFINFEITPREAIRLP